jgi:hypothetical protein
MKSATRVPYIMGESFLVDAGRFNAWSWSPIALLNVSTVGWILEYDRGHCGR